MWTKNGILQPGQAFDMGRCSPVLTNLLKQREQTCKSKDMHALVPGCGRGYDVFEFARFGYTALGIDLSTTAVQEATKLRDEIMTKEKLPGDTSFSLQNFYDLQPPKDGFDVIWDYTFLCAMPPELREKWAKNMRRLIAPEGELVTGADKGAGEYEGGPPYAMSRELVSGLLEAQESFLPATKKALTERYAGIPSVLYGACDWRAEPSNQGRQGGNTLCSGCSAQHCNVPGRPHPLPHLYSPVTSPGRGGRGGGAGRRKRSKDAASWRKGV
eukprot:756207-Hanusia_phi.AAC.5